jgi:hypothetical protein
MAVHTLSGKAQTVEIRLSRQVDALFDLLHNREHEVNGALKLRLKPYGYLWLREGRGPESLAGTTD